MSIWSNASGSGSLASGSVLSGVHGISMLVNVSGVARARGYEIRDMSAGGTAPLCF